jgi:hypothetical protein
MPLHSLILIAVFLCIPQTASAYTDPGSGVFLMQTFYAAMIGGVFYLRRFLNRFTGRKK